MKILVLNSGSSSIKYSLFDIHTGVVLVAGAVERIGESVGQYRYRRYVDAATVDERKTEEVIANHHDGLMHIVRLLGQSGALEDLRQLAAIGHRVVHGGDVFREPVRIDGAAIRRIRALTPLAPLHNPANLTGIELALELAPEVPQVAVFDTAFHQTLPPYAFHYAVPYELYREDHVRRYGFHGTSHRFVARRAAEFLGRTPESLNLITLHLGNGASVAAIRQGVSIDTSMGMTPLEGLIMGSRCGDIDPAIHFYLQRQRGLSSSEVESMLNRESGLKGICGANDMREVHRLAAAGNSQARLALEMYVYRIKKYIGAYYGILGRLDALVFTGGIGENDAWVRANACAGLEMLGIRVDPSRNNGSGNGIHEIQRESGTVQVLVVPTDEELEIALQARQCLGL